MESTKFINKALEYTGGELSASEFVKYVDYPIDAFMIDKFWYTMREKRYIYVDNELLEWMGYSNNLAKQKQLFMELLCGPLEAKQNRDYLYYSNDEYEKFLSDFVYCIQYTKYYPLIDKSHGKNMTKHVLLTPEYLRLAMMRLTTKRAIDVGKYYIALEHLFVTYVEYQSEFRHRLNNEPRGESNQLAVINKKTIEDTQTALVQARRECDRLKAENERQNKCINSLGEYNEELLQQIRDNSKNQTLYVGTTYDYARQGLFKVSKTNDVKKRITSLNTSHPCGDTFIIVHKIACNDALLLERQVKTLLKAFRPSLKREYYKIPFDLLLRMLNRLEEDTNSQESLAIELGDILAYMKRTDYHGIIWTNGIDLELLALPPSKEPLLITASDTMEEQPVIEKTTVAASIEPTTEQQESVDPDVLDLLEQVIRECEQTQKTTPAATVDAQLAPGQPMPAIAQVPIQQNTDAHTVTIQFTFTVGTLTPAETEEIIRSSLSDYKKTLTGRKKPTWKTLKAYLNGIFKSKCKQPKLDNGKTQIKGLCIEYKINIE